MTCWENSAFQTCNSTRSSSSSSSRRRTDCGGGGCNVVRSERGCGKNAAHGGHAPPRLSLGDRLLLLLGFCHNLGNCSRPTLTGEGWGRGEGGGRSWKAWLQLQDNACCSAQPRPSLPAGGGWLAASKGHSRGRARPRVSPDLHTTHNPKFATAPSWEKCINQMRLLEESSVH